MAKNSLFSTEKKIIDSGKSIIGSGEYEDNPLLDAYNGLLDNYQKLFKQFARMVKINDKQQQQLLETQESILDINTELKQLNATKDKFFSIIAHDLKSPIISFMNVTTLLVDHIGKFSPEEIQEMAKDAKISGDNLFKLLENLLSWARLQMERIQFRPNDCSLKFVVEDIIGLLSNTAANKGVRLRNWIPEDTLVYADSNMLNTIINNLVSNAIKFSSRDDEITITSKDTGQTFAVTVSDTGVGMTEETRNKLFRIDVTHTTLGTAEEKGTGLGLILCKEMVEKHSGKIWVESEFGKSTAFTFSLPKNKE